MARRVSRWIGLIASSLGAIWAPETCRAQQSKPTMDQIIQVWQQRQEKVLTAHFELNCEQTIHKGSISFFDAMVSEKVKPLDSEPNPSRDYLVNGTATVNLSGQKMTYSYDTQKWDPIGKRLYPARYFDSFDGQLFKCLDNPASGQQDYPLATVRRAKASASALHFPLLPLVFAFRGDHSQFFQDLGRFKVNGRRIDIAARPCLEVVRTSGSSNRCEVLYLDEERDYVVVRKTILIKDFPAWQLDIIYDQDDTVGWSPRSWEYIIRAGKNHIIIESGRRTVTRYDINHQIDDSKFEIIFPAGTRVIDESSGKETQYLVRGDQERGREIPTAFNPTYEDLENAGTQVKRWVLATVWGTILVLSLGVWIWLRLRRVRS